MIPEDLDYVDKPQSIQKIEGPPVGKRQKMSEANVEASA